MSVRVSTRADGDFHLDRVDPVVLCERQRALVPGRWTMLAEVHGTSVVHVDEPGAGDRRCGDIALVSTAEAVVGTWVGDCAPLVLAGDDGRFAAVHAGWRGIVDGIVDVAVAALDGGVQAAWLGPSIRACCYEFGSVDLLAVADAVGADRTALAGTTTWGMTSLDIPAALRSVLSRHDVALGEHGACTGCDPDFFSHRMGPDPERHVVAVWSERCPA